MSRLARSSLLPAAFLLALLAGGALAQGEGQTARDPLWWTHSVWGWIQASGVIGMVIVAQSVLVGAIVIEQAATIRREKLAPPDLLEELDALLEEKAVREALELCAVRPCFLANAVAAGLAKVGHPYETIEKAAADAGEAEAIRLHQRVGWLSLHANIAPMLGLLGTVQGMIGAFNVIAAKRGQANPADFAADIAVALLTTLFGLLVAIPVMAVFAQMRNRVTRLSIEVGDLAVDLLERYRGGKA
ncbi:MAG: MotA/TolQ/ExbB proton channel family protein [Planctomycetota bacterium]